MIKESQNVLQNKRKERSGNYGKPNKRQPHGKGTKRFNASVDTPFAARQLIPDRFVHTYYNYCHIFIRVKHIVLHYNLLRIV